MPPPGGPVDTTPPAVAGSDPPPGATNVRRPGVRLTFSEPVDRRSVQEALFISPSPGEPEFSWSGDEVDILFGDSLKSNTTYVVSLGTDVVDTRNRNRMAEAFTLAFATGERIDSGSAAGAVFDAQPEGVMIFAYELAGRNPDTLDPARVRPEYVTQTGKRGTFLLPHLRLGEYRIIAVRDEFRNLTYDRQTDQYGVFAERISLSDSGRSASGLQCMLRAEDTTHPFLSSAACTDRRHVLLRFSEAMDTSGSAPDLAAVTDTATGSRVPVLDFSFIGVSAREAQLATQAMDSGRGYRVSVRELKDRSGLALRASEGEAAFACDAPDDTARPSLELLSPAPNAAGVDPRDSVLVAFSEAVDRTRFMGGFRLEDSAKSPVAGSFLWRNSALAAFLPGEALAPAALYRVRIRADSVVDVSGKRMGDSAAVFAFTTVDTRSWGSVSGSVAGRDASFAGTVYVAARPVAPAGNRPRRVVLAQDGAVGFSDLLEGTYTLWTFQDSDGDGAYSFGSVFPFRPAERFGVMPDTLRVRARWPLEGAALRLR